jgi:hypothetical protein
MKITRGIVILSEAKDLTDLYLITQAISRDQIISVRSLGPSRTGIVCATRDDQRL